MTDTTDRLRDMSSSSREDEEAIHVLHVAENVKGGIATYLDAVLKYRAEQTGPASVSLLLPTAERGQVQAPDGVRVDTYAYRGRGPLSLARLIWVIWKKIRTSNPDVVHFHSSFPGFAGRFPALFRRKQPAIVFCAHGWSFEMEMSHWRQALYAKIEKWLSLGTDAIVNISMSDHRASLAAGLDESRCVYIPNGIDFVGTNTGDDSVAMERDVINLLFVGRFDRQKGIDLLMDAMAKLLGQPIRLFVVGESVLGGADVVPSENVEFLGWRSRDRLRSLFAQADAVVMPSRWEGFGMVAIEAMCCGTAVIASDRGALPEIVRHGETGLIFGQEDPDDLVHMLTALDRTVLERMGEAGQRRYRKFYTARVMNERLEILYRLLADGRGLDEIREAVLEVQSDSGQSSDSVAGGTLAVAGAKEDISRVGVSAL